MKPGRRRRRRRGRERNWLRMEDKPSLDLCVCVCRKKLLAPPDGLDEGSVSQSPSHALLGRDEEQKERCVVGPRGF